MARVDLTYKYTKYRHPAPVFYIYAAIIYKILSEYLSQPKTIMYLYSKRQRGTSGFSSRLCLWHRETALNLVKMKPARVDVPEGLFERWGRPRPPVDMPSRP